MKEHSKEFLEVWAVLKETAIETKETDRRMKETDKRMKETDKKIDKLQAFFDVEMKETDKRMKETDKKIDKLQGIVGGIGNNNGYVAEELFYNSFSKSMSLGNISFDFIDRNLERTYKGLRDEFDIILTNSNFLVVVEVKYNFHPNDVKTVLKKIRNIRKLFPNYKNYKIYGAVAGLSMPQRTIELAKEFGFFVLTQEGNHLKVLNEDVAAYKDKINGIEII